MARATQHTSLHAIGVPPAVIAQVDKDYRLSKRRLGRPQIQHLVEYTAADVMRMEFVGAVKLQQTRDALARHGYVLKYDPPIDKAKQRSTLTPEQVSEIRRKMRQIRRLTLEVGAVLSGMPDSLSVVDCAGSDAAVEAESADTVDLDERRAK